MQRGKPFNKMPFKLATAAVFIAFSAIIGLLEKFIPVDIILPLPGVKLGLANIFITASLYVFGAKHASCVLFGRIILTFIFSGNSVSLLLSFFGGLISFFVLVFAIKLHKIVLSFVGISVLSSVFHGLGQVFAGYFLVGKTIFHYIPILGIACVLTGVLTGLIMNIVIKYLSTLLMKG